MAGLNGQTGKRANRLKEKTVAVNVTMPKWGLTMKEGKITRWFKSEGDTIQQGEPFFEVETEKITNSVEAEASGVVFQIVVSAGETVAVGSIVAIIAQPDEQPRRIDAASAAAAVSPATDEKAPPVRDTASAKGEFVRATPAARRLAKDLGIDLTAVAGTGPKGRVSEADVQQYRDSGTAAPRATPLALEMIRQAGLDAATIAGSGERGKITQKDVEQALAQQTPEPAPASVPSIPFTGMRRSIAENMHASLQNTAQLTIFTEVDVTEMIRFRDVMREQQGNDDAPKPSVTDILILAVSRALGHFPIMNSTLIDDDIILHDSVHMGIAVALPDGLMVPVLRDADQKGLLEIARGSRALARKAREGTLTVDEVTGGTFTLSNLGMFAVDGVTPILKPPETGILGVGRIKAKPAVHNGDIAIRSMMFLSLTFDHRVVDGAPAAKFLEAVGRFLENPYLMMA
jgi:pyruvate dehydrogenase E2 component (dihydrolipoamide acetyltransferase)